MTTPSPRTLAGRAPGRRLVRRAKELSREARVLVRKKGKRAGADAVSAVSSRVEALDAALPRRGAPGDESALERAMEALDRAVDAHFGRFRKSLLREYVEAIAWAVGLALLIRSFLFEAFSIPSGSMLPTLEIGDRLFVNKIGYGLYLPFSPRRLLHWDEPDRGDVIVFKFSLPGDRNDGEDYIKRVVAIPGDRLRLEGNRLWMNGEPVPTEELGEVRCPIYDGREDEPVDPVGHCACVSQRETLGGRSFVTQHMKASGSPFLLAECQNHPDWPLRDGVDPRPGRYFGEAAENPNWPDLVVPEGHVFVMGDNRDRSEDGRYWGLVPFDHIKGTAFVIWWARDRSRLFTWLD